jgi:hypothetical protein
MAAPNALWTIVISSRCSAAVAGQRTLEEAPLVGHASFGDIVHEI